MIKVKVEISIFHFDFFLLLLSFDYRSYTILMYGSLFKEVVHGEGDFHEETKRLSVSVEGFYDIREADRDDGE